MAVSSQVRPTERTIYTDFVEYQDRDLEDPVDPVRSMIYAIDTNVLLNLYKYSASTSHDVIAALRNMSEVLFVPHHTMREFWHLQEDVRKGGHHQEASRKLGGFVEDIERTVGTWLSRTGLAGSRGDVASDVQDKLIQLGDLADAIQQTIDETRDQAAQQEDHIITSLDEILTGSVGPAPTAVEFDALQREFAKRVAAGIPPGTRDAELKSGDLAKAAGDYIIWRQCIDEAVRRKGLEGRTFDLTLITNDLKDDWVRDRSGPCPLARRQLVREYADAVGGVFRIASFSNLLDTAARHFNAQVSEEARTQVDAVTHQARGSWSIRSARAYIDALRDYYIDKGHLDVVLASYSLAHDGIGPLTISMAKQLCNKATMNNFVKPFTTIMGWSTVVDANESDLEEPLVTCEFDATVGEKVFRIQPEALAVVGEIINTDDDYRDRFDQVCRRLRELRDLGDLEQTWP